MTTRTILHLVNVDSYEHGKCSEITVEHLGHSLKWTIVHECRGCEGAGAIGDWDPRVSHRCERCAGDAEEVDYHHFPLSAGALWMVFDEAFDCLSVDKLQLTAEERAQIAAHEDGRAQAEGRISRSHLLQPAKPECSICRRRHGGEVQHASE